MKGASSENHQASGIFTCDHSALTRLCASQQLICALH
jgi:hypothetical protein